MLKKPFLKSLSISDESLSKFGIPGTLEYQRVTSQGSETIGSEWPDKCDKTRFGSVAGGGGLCSHGHPPQVKSGLWAGLSNGTVLPMKRITVTWHRRYGNRTVVPTMATRCHALSCHTGPEPKQCQKYRLISGVGFIKPFSSVLLVSLFFFLEFRIIKTLVTYWISCSYLICISTA